mgnify:CR=1 FL=1
MFIHKVFARELENLQYGDVATIQSLETLFVNLVKVVVALSGVALFVMLIVGGFTFLFSGGDNKQLEQARGTVTNAIIGLVVIVSAYLILRVIQVFTGVDVTKFSIPK